MENSCPIKTESLFRFIKQAQRLGADRKMKGDNARVTHDSLIRDFSILMKRLESNRT